jgi:hypothetical protein
MPAILPAIGQDQGAGLVALLHRLHIGPHGCQGDRELVGRTELDEPWLWYRG